MLAHNIPVPRLLRCAGARAYAVLGAVAILPGAAGVLGERLGLEVIGVVIASAALALLALHELLVTIADRRT